MAELPAREFTRAVRDWSAAHGLFPRRTGAVAGRGDREGAALGRTRVVVGVSGGPDSMALLAVLHELAGPLGLFLHVAHLDHGLRRGSASDARFTAARARALGRPFTCGFADVAALSRRRKISIEEAGRLARYSFFFRVARRARARLVAVGHTRDDQAETVLMRLVRGAAMNGLSGIAPRRALHDPLAPGRGGTRMEVIRPILGRSRAEVEAFLRLKGISARRDPSNASPAFLRNRIRHELIPFLERRFNPVIRASLAQAAGILAEEDALLEDAAARALARIARGRSVDARALSRLPVAMRRRVLRIAAVRAGADPNRLGGVHLDWLVRVAAAGKGEAALPGIRASVARGILRLVPRRS